MTRALRSTSVLVAAAIATAIARPAAGFPAPSRSDPRLDALRQAAASNTDLVDSPIFRDSIPGSRTVYVGPASREIVVTTGLARTSLPLDCAGLASAYRNTYKMPAIDYRAAARQPFSPFFDVSFGNYVRVESSLDAVLKLGDDINAIRQAHSAEYSAVVTARENERILQADVDLIIGQMNQLDGNVSSLRFALELATDPEAKALIQETLDEIQAERDRLMPGLTDALAAARRKRDEASVARTAAEAAFAPFQQQIDDLASQREKRRRAVEATESLTKTAFDNAVATLRRYEGAVAAFADVQVTPWVRELEALQALADRDGSPEQRLTVVRLPIVDGLLFPVSTASGGSHLSGVNSVGLPYRADRRVGDPPGAVAVATDPVALAPLYRRSSGALMPFSWGAAASTPGGNGTLRLPLSRRTLCGGENAISTVPLSGDLQVGGTTSALRWTGRSFTPVNSGSSAQDLELAYRYLATAEPLPVVCTVQIAAFQKRLSSSVETTWLDGQSWSDARFQEVEAAGLHCAPTPGSDLGARQDVDRRRTLQRATEELIAELVTLFGTSWQTTVRSNTAGEDAASSATVRSACGDTAHCSLSAVAFRPVEMVLPDARSMAAGEPLVRDFLSAPWRLLRSRVKVAIDIFL